MADIHTIPSLGKPLETMTPDAATVTLLTMSQLWTALGAFGTLDPEGIPTVNGIRLIAHARRVLDAVERDLEARRR